MKALLRLLILLVLPWADAVRAADAPPPLVIDPAAVAKALTLSCATPFDLFVRPLLHYCDRWPGRHDDLALIEEARDTLIRLGLVEASLFEGVEISWCPLEANGMAPRFNRVVLHPAYKTQPVDLIALLGHEMVHIGQYRRMGEQAFRCRYGQEIAAGHGMHRQNPLERDAYEAEEQIRQRLRQALASPSPGGGLGQRCRSSEGQCFLPQAQPLGAVCGCPSEIGLASGVVY